MVATDHYAPDAETFQAVLRPVQQFAISILALHRETGHGSYSGAAYFFRKPDVMSASDIITAFEIRASRLINHVLRSLKGCNGFLKSCGLNRPKWAADKDFSLMWTVIGKRASHAVLPFYRLGQVGKR